MEAGVNEEVKEKPDKPNNEQDEENQPESLESADNLSERLEQLQQLVLDMKAGFGQVMSTLHDIRHGDALLQKTVNKNKADYEEKLSDVVHMVLSLQSEFGSVVGQVNMTNESHRNLENQVEYLQFERDALIEDLENAGAITNSTRKRFHSGKLRPTISGSSTDSTSLALLRSALENTSSDRDSGVLTSHPGDGSSGVSGSPRSMEMSPTSGRGSPKHHIGGSPHIEGPPHPEEGEPRVQSYVASLPPTSSQEDGYESDSSLTQAANRSLDLSRSLGDQCAELEDEEMEGGEEGSEIGIRSDQDDQEELNEAILVEPNETSSPRKPKSSVKKPLDISHRQVQRSRVALEILETEKKYCNNLWIILEHFASPLKQGTIISLKDVSIMFPVSLGHIYDRHCQLLQRLEERLTSWKYQGLLGDIFARFIDENNSLLLAQYQTYVADFPLALRLIKKMCRQSRAFRKYLKRRQQDPVCESLDIAAFMLTPVQRVPRYVLLLKQLLKYTDNDHPDFYQIQTSLKKLGGFLNQLNDSIQLSMQIVAGNTPKVKSKRLGRSFSLRSTSSCDEEMITNSNSHSNSSHGFFNTSFFSRSARVPVLDASNNLSKPQTSGCSQQGHSFLLPNKPVLPSRPQSESVMRPHSAIGNHSDPNHDRPHSAISNHSDTNHVPPMGNKPVKLRQRDQTFKGFDSFTVPLQAEKRRKTKSKELTLGQGALNVSNNSMKISPNMSHNSVLVPGIQVNGLEHSYAMKPPLPRSRSVADPSVTLPSKLHSGSTLNSNYMPAWSMQRSQESMSSFGESHNISLGSAANTSGYSCEFTKNSGFHYGSMPKLAGEFGIYGVQDEHVDTVNASTTDRNIILQSRSHMDLGRDRAWSPSQLEINSALAHSLYTDSTSIDGGRDSFRQPKPPKLSSTPCIVNKPKSYDLNTSVQSSNTIPKSNSEIVNRNKQLTINQPDDSVNDSVNVTINKGNGRWEWRRKKKNNDISMSQGDVSIVKNKKKSNSFKQSIKNLFSRKKSSSKVSQFHSFAEYSNNHSDDSPTLAGSKPGLSNSQRPSSSSLLTPPTSALDSTQSTMSSNGSIRRPLSADWDTLKTNHDLSHFIVTSKSSSAINSDSVNNDGLKQNRSSYEEFGDEEVSMV